MTNPRNESLREPLRNKCLGRSGLGIEAWKRAKSGKRLFSTLLSNQFVPMAAAHK